MCDMQYVYVMVCMRKSLVIIRVFVVAVLVCMRGKCVCVYSTPQLRCWYVCVGCVCVRVCVCVCVQYTATAVLVCLRRMSEQRCAAVDIVCVRRMSKIVCMRRM